MTKRHHVIVLACVMVLAHVMVLADVIVLACVMVLTRIMSPLRGSHGLSARRGVKDEVKQARRAAS